MKDFSPNFDNSEIFPESNRFDLFQAVAEIY